MIHQNTEMSIVQVKCYLKTHTCKHMTPGSHDMTPVSHDMTPGSYDMCIT